jgi:hypothetical protein
MLAVYSKATVSFKSSERSTWKYFYYEFLLKGKLSRGFNGPSSSGIRSVVSLLCNLSALGWAVVTTTNVKPTKDVIFNMFVDKDSIMVDHLIEILFRVWRFCVSLVLLYTCIGYLIVYLQKMVHI